MSYENIDDLEYHLHSFSCVLNRNAFEITPVEFVQLNHACHDCSMSESNLHFKNLIAETEAQQQIKRAKAKEYLNKSRSKETVEQKQARLAKAKHIVKRKHSLQNDLERQTRLENAKHYMNRKRSLETDLDRQMRLEKNWQNMKRRRQNAKTQSRLEEEKLSETVVNVVSQS